MEKLRQTPSQTVGPFFAYGLTARQYGYDFTSIAENIIASEGLEKQQIYITGRVFDGKGNSIHDAMIELCQVDGQGKSRLKPIEQHDSGFIGFGRMGTGTLQDHSFRFVTIKPGSINGQPPHINVILFMRGSLRHLYTRLYFSDETNDADELLTHIEAKRRQTLIAQRIERNNCVEYHFDIYMQGEKETVFFDLLH